MVASANRDSAVILSLPLVGNHVMESLYKLLIAQCRVSGLSGLPGRHALKHVALLLNQGEDPAATLLPNMGDETVLVQTEMRHTVQTIHRALHIHDHLSMVTGQSGILGVNAAPPVVEDSKQENADVMTLHHNMEETTVLVAIRISEFAIHTCALNIENPHRGLHGFLSTLLKMDTSNRDTELLAEPMSLM